MKITVLITRTLLGLVYFVFGVLYFMHVFKTPPMTGKIAAFNAGLAATGYFFPFLKVVETIGGFFILINRYTLLFLVVLFPVTLNIFLYHTLMDTSGFPMAIVMITIQIFLFYAYRKYYTALLVSSPTV